MADLAYPNLVPVAPEPRAPSIYNDVTGTRFLVRFDGYVQNAGPGPLELRGSTPFGPPQERAMTSVIQRLYETGDTSSPFVDEPSPAVLRYETNDGHQHWHLRHATRYSLWNHERTAEVAPGHKIGFCLADIEPVLADAPPAHYEYGGNVDRCSWLDPTAPDATGPNAASAFMGISPGWRDVYAWILPLQWVDVANVPPGHYWLRAEVNPDSVVIEDPTATVDPPVYAAHATTIPGYVAQPVEAGHVPANTTSRITLSAESYSEDADNLGTKAFKIVDLPDHGTLTVDGQPVGHRWWPRSTFTYTPDSDYFGPDSIGFAAGDYSRLAYPEAPPVAAATMQVGIGGETALTISGAPAEVVAGGSVQLRAIVTAGPSPRVAWSVDGIAGGAAHIGTIAADGLFRAPDHLHNPAGDMVRIGATTEDGVSDHVDLRIVPIPKPVPLPDVPAPPVLPPAPTRDPPVMGGRHTVGSTRRRKARRPRMVLRGRRGVLVRIVPGRAGRLTIVLRKGRSRAGSCALRAVPDVAATCRIRVPPRFAGSRRRVLSAVALLRVRGKVVKRWRAAIERPRMRRVAP